MKKKNNKLTFSKFKVTSLSGMDLIKGGDTSFEAFPGTSSDCTNTTGRPTATQMVCIETSAVHAVASGRN